MGSRVSEVEWRRARRAFLRTHHPDLGGDPEAFVAGLAQFDADAKAARPGPVMVVRTPHGVRGWCRHLVGAARRRTRRSPPRVR